MADGHHDRVETLLREAAADHLRLLGLAPEELRASLPVDAQGVTRAIDHLAIGAGFSEEQRRALVRGHGVNPAVLHARVFGGVPLERGTVIGAFVDGARVRADALGTLADAIGGTALGTEVRSLLTEHPLPFQTETDDAVEALKDAYRAHELAALRIAAALDAAL